MILNRLTRKHLLIMAAFGLLVAFIVMCLYTTGAFRPESLDDTCDRYSKVDTTNSTLELVHIVLRHGPRTPVDTYPNDSYVNATFYPTGWGHITNKGKRELYELGSWLSRRYGSYMGPYYTPDGVHAQATASPRALMTLSTVLASMFAPKGTAMDWHDNFNWQPIPIFSEPLEQDSLLLVRTSCPRYFEALDEVLQLPEVQEELVKYETLFKNLSKITGMRVDNAEAINSIYITLQAEKEFGLPLPSWTKDYFPDKMQYLAEQSYIYSAYTTEMQKIKGGPFLKKMFKEMLEKRANALSPSKRKLFIYTGHDWTVGNILAALKVWERQMPLFSIMAIFELHRHHNTGQYYVEVFLRNGVRNCLKQLKIPGCDFKCPLDKMIELGAQVLPNEPYEDRCRAKNKDYIEPLPRPVDQTPSD